MIMITKQTAFVQIKDNDNEVAINNINNNNKFVNYILDD